MCVLDDISRAPGEALNVLLRVLNERKWGNGVRAVAWGGGDIECRTLAHFASGIAGYRGRNPTTTTHCHCYWYKNLLGPPSLALSRLRCCCAGNPTDDELG